MSTPPNPEIVLRNDAPAPAWPLDGAAASYPNVIGGGSFCADAGGGHAALAWSMLGVWALGGLLAFASAMSYQSWPPFGHGRRRVRLSRARSAQLPPFSRDGRRSSQLLGAIAATSGACRCIGRFFPAAGDKTPLLTIPIPLVPLVSSRPSPSSPSPDCVRALPRHGRFVHNVLAAAKVSVLLVLIAIGFSFGNSTQNSLASTRTVDSVATGWLLSSHHVQLLRLERGRVLAEEIRDRRNVPLALGLGTLAVIVIYLALNTTALHALPINKRPRCRVRAPHRRGG